MPPRLKMLEAQAHAAGRAFAYEEADFDARYEAPQRPARMAAIAVAAGASFIAFMHFLGLTSAFGWRSAA